MLEIQSYDSQYETMWDQFVLESTVNGTFLQTRRFLNYHPEGRFQDASFMVFDKKGHLVAVCPACAKIEDGGKLFDSHAGSTYGGILIEKKWYKAGKVLDIIQALENHLRNCGFDKVILRQTPSILSVENVDLLQYCFYYLGYQCCNALSLYVDFDGYKEDILAEFSQGKRTDVHNCQKRGLYDRKLTSFSEIEQLHSLLSKSLEKYHTKPIHTAEELYSFQEDRLKGECECFGIFDGDKMVASSMLFYFMRNSVAHTQYLCADPDYKQISPMTYLYYTTLVEMRKRGYKKVSWGTGTENLGRYLNEGLVKSKEYYGSRHNVNLIFIKKINKS